MKFGKRIQEASGASVKLCKAEEWLDYKQLKKKLHKLDVRSAQQLGKKRNLQDVEGEKGFFKLLLSELRKVAATFKRLETSVSKQFLEFVPILSLFKASVSSGNESSFNVAHVSELLQRCADIHLQYVLLESYAVMNYCGFTKILKKHDKVTGFQTREKYMMKMVNDQAFAKHRRVNIALEVVEAEFQVLRKIIMRLEKVKSANNQEMAEPEADALNHEGYDKTMRDSKAVSQATHHELAKEKDEVVGTVTNEEEKDSLCQYKNHQDRLDSLVHILKSHVKDGKQSPECEQVHPKGIEEGQEKKKQKQVMSAPIAQV
mmetsp:Transcript_12283/g.14108  ORF Transcript_12283/g.14108 Transcript_12283/m.14108 type:complete len:317 (+) Transcript_12283:248-1198(+)|eukprot:CAMPEP_0184073538 /NCGR_PEP_ID=MMETSP0957-20130417/64714_1 /TAXON_ID=627963 /ORGANISM="Aplanochytrium sp, Strain PBS07" /LENGTH=316 /DNA_ID=CAMNT_0026375227 /DNA_START=175 /DNA_END=1125 /DNA_ORIENTATION=+